MRRNEKRRSLRRKYGDNCYLCGKLMSFDPVRANCLEYATLDHVIPRAVGGANHQENLRLAHRICNQFRSTYQDEEFKTIEEE